TVRSHPPASEALFSTAGTVISLSVWPIADGVSLKIFKRLVHSGCHWFEPCIRQCPRSLLDCQQPKVENMSTETKCPFNHAAGGGTTNRDWWPKQLNLKILHQPSSLSDPMGDGFDYAKEFNSLDLAAVKKDLLAVMTDSQEWWPGDFGHHG